MPRIFAMVFHVLFLLLQEKYQKNQPKGALRAALPRVKDAPFGIPSPHRRVCRSTLTYIRIQAEMFRFLPGWDLLRTDGRKSAHFRLSAKMNHLPVQEGDLQGGRLCKKSPLYRLLFALFLPIKKRVPICSILFPKASASSAEPFAFLPLTNIRPCRKIAENSFRRNAP